MNLNNTRKAQMDIIFFNRASRVGSQALMKLLKHLSTVNKFDILPKKNMNTGKTYSLDKQRLTAEHIASLEDSTIYIEPTYYINFTDQYVPRPIYINMIRDPIDRVVSWYYYKRTPWYIVARYNLNNNLTLPDPKSLKTSYETCVRYKEQECVYIEGSELEGSSDYKRQMISYCGHDEAVCVPFNSLAALQRAKRNVEEDYSVIGTWEDTNITLSVFEHYIPKYFYGATSKYHELNKHNGMITNKSTFKNHVAEDIKDMVRKQFKREIEFYEFCRQRLHKQYLALNLWKLQ